MSAAVCAVNQNPFKSCSRARTISRLLDVSAQAFDAWETEKTAENWDRWIEARHAIDAAQRGAR